MTRPRSQQILDLQTRFSKLKYTPTPGSKSDSIFLASVYDNTITGIIGGVEEQIQPILRSTVIPPYLIAAGDAIMISQNGGAAVIVTFTSTDITASKIALRINSKIVSASAFAGQLIILSYIPGKSGSIVISDVVPGTLAKIGLIAGTYYGVDPSKRGIVTLSNDYFDASLGGDVILKTTDGRDVISDTSASLLLGDKSGEIIRGLEIPGGAPIHARIHDVGSFLILNYNARMPLRSEIETYGSDFGSLDSSDTIDILVVDPEFGFSTSITVTFPSGPGLTRDQVATTINQAWSTQLSLSGSGAAHVSGNIIQPYTFSGVSKINIAIDGAAFTTVDLTGATTALDVATAINLATSSTIAVAVTTATGIVVSLQSGNSDGTTSEIEITPPPGGRSDVFAVLGLIPGRYKGYYLAQPSGPSEIMLFGVGRGYNPYIQISSTNAVTLERMGLFAAITHGKDEGEQAVSFPEMGRTVGDVVPVVALIPEVMDFGEIPDNDISVTSKFLDKVSSTTTTSATKIYSVDGSPFVGNGLKDAGKSAPVSPDGLLSNSIPNTTRSEYENLFKYIVHADFSKRIVTSVVANNIEGGGVAGNPTPVSESFKVDVDPSDAKSSVVRSFSISFGRDGTPFFPFEVKSLVPAVNGITWLVDAADTGADKTALSNTTGPLRLYDINTAAAGASSGGSKVIVLSSATATEGDDTIRVMDSQSGNKEPVSVFRGINAKFGTSVGDGINSFGEFNGPDAIQKAIAFFVTNRTSGSLRIFVKHGSYAITTINPIVVPSGVGLILEGESGSIFDTRIATSQSVPASILVNNNSTLDLRDVSIGGIGYDFVLEVKGELLVRDTSMSRTSIKWNDGISGIAERCSISSVGCTLPLLEILAGNGVTKTGFVFRDCKFVGGDSLPILKVGPSSLTGLTAIENISFIRCNIACGSTSYNTTTNNLTGNSGVIDIDPGTAGGSLTTSFGPYLKKVEWIDCDVTASSTGTAAVLIHLIPVANAVYTTAIPFNIAANSAMRIDKVVISGGRWIAPRVSTAVNAFTIGLSARATETKDINFGRVEISNWDFEIDTSSSTHVTQGAATQDSDSFFTSVVTNQSGHTAVGSWGAVAISAIDLVMRDCELSGFNQSGNCGDILWKIDGQGKIDNIKISGYVIGVSGSVPDQRIRTRFGAVDISSYNDPRNIEISNVSIIGNDASATTLWAIDSIWQHEPSQTPVTILNCSIDNFTTNLLNNSSNCFGIVDASANSIWGTNYGNTGTVDNLIIDGMICAHGTYGIHIARNLGINKFKKITIKNCSIHDNDYGGIFYSVATIGIGLLTITGNNVHNNGTVAGIIGIVVSCDDWTDHPSEVIVTNNNVYDNSSSGLSPQISIISNNSGTQSPLGIVYGNSLVGIGVIGTLKINRMVLGVSTALVSPSVPVLRGIETGYVGGTTPGNSCFFDTGIDMIHNIGSLTSP